MADDRRLVARAASAARALVPALDDVLAVAGFGLLVYGVYLVSIPAAFITAGVLLLAAAYRYGGPTT